MRWQRDTLIHALDVYKIAPLTLCGLMGERNHGYDILSEGTVVTCVVCATWSPS